MDKLTFHTKIHSLTHSTQKHGIKLKQIETQSKTLRSNQIHTHRDQTDRQKTSLSHRERHTQTDKHTQRQRPPETHIHTHTHKHRHTHTVDQKLDQNISIFRSISQKVWMKTYHI